MHIPIIFRSLIFTTATSRWLPRYHHQQYDYPVQDLSQQIAINGVSRRGINVKLQSLPLLTPSAPRCLCSELVQQKVPKAKLPSPCPYLHNFDSQQQHCRLHKRPSQNSKAPYCSIILRFHSQTKTRILPRKFTSQQIGLAPNSIPVLQAEIMIKL